MDYVITEADRQAVRKALWQDIPKTIPRADRLLLLESLYLRWVDAVRARHTPAPGTLPVTGTASQKDVKTAQ